MRKANKRQIAMNCNIALYVHIPFCRRKCNYCSFVSYEGRDADIPAYVNALKEELALHATGQQVSSIYFGGGTPSLLYSEQMGDILSTIRSLFRVGDEAEVTMEANPGTFDEPYIAAISNLGINRLSLGIQSLNNDELALLGRIHTAAEARDAMRFVRDSGFTNVSLDLIYGLPGSRLADWKNTLEEVIELDPEHISLYPLTLENNLPMKTLIDLGELPALDPDDAADQYELAEDLLGEYGYHHYEISNWAKNGWECQHNLIYWQNMPYLGVGVAAHSYIDGRRLANTTDIDRYLYAFPSNASLATDTDEEIQVELKLSETIILGLRLSAGVCLDDINRRFGVDFLTQYSTQVDDLTSLGLLECDGKCIRLTRRGRLLGNQVFLRFLPEEMIDA